MFQRKNLKATGPVLSEKGQPRLIHIKGRKRIFVRQVELARDSLNEGDVFILDNGKDILYQWNGRKSNRIEKGKALDMLKNIKGKEKGGELNFVCNCDHVTDFLFRQCSLCHDGPGHFRHRFAS